MYIGCVYIYIYVCNIYYTYTYTYNICIESRHEGPLLHMVTCETKALSPMARGWQVVQFDSRAALHVGFGSCWICAETADAEHVLAKIATGAKELRPGPTPKRVDCSDCRIFVLSGLMGTILLKLLYYQYCMLL